jgi:carbonic anhydrase
MSCSNKTGPVNIVSTNITCNKKCNFMYKYNISSIVTTNEKSYLSIKLDNTNSQSVNYSSNSGRGSCSSFVGGGSDLGVSEIRVYSPSLHKYDGYSAAAELVIYHNNMAGGKNLIVCIPIIENLGSLRDATTQLSSIINYISKSGNNSGEADNVQGLNFNLNNFIPQEKFYSYTATLPFHPCTNCVDYIVFDNISGSIGLSKETMIILKKLVKTHTITTKKITNNLGYAYSSKKPSYGSTNTTNDIYIDCKPTGTDGEILIEETKSNVLNGYSFNMPENNFISKETWYIILFVLLFIVLMFVIIKVLKKLSTKPSGIKGGGYKSGGYKGGGRVNINRFINKSKLKL